MSVLRSVIGRFASKSQFSDLRGPCNNILARSMGSKASVDGVPVEVGGGDAAINVLLHSRITLVSYVGRVFPYSLSGAQSGGLSSRSSDQEFAWRSLAEGIDLVRLPGRSLFL